ncbi:hypothetical protein [Marinobacter alexandrii]|jgi:hypothetical protein|uniref:hypothetical protein n=1 Tax=Marinobacter alexandrii TaxID=2570351 RepID=UPI001FFF4E32|nr:hypothetical protein [Marinobacter alexandrii]MCK2150507.1 hypothetical protein [Marinobacter alexandrii]
MKSLLLFIGSVTLSTYALAGNMLSSDSMDATRDATRDKNSFEKILSNKDLERLHKEMTRYGMSEIGMEARRQMIGTEEGHAYHRALQKKEKNTAG